MTWPFALAFTITFIALAFIALMAQKALEQNTDILRRLSSSDANLTHAAAKRLELDAHLAHFTRTLQALTEELGLDREEPPV